MTPFRQVPGAINEKVPRQGCKRERASNKKNRNTRTSNEKNRTKCTQTSSRYPKTVKDIINATAAGSFDDLTAGT